MCLKHAYILNTNKVFYIKKVRRIGAFQNLLFVHLIFLSVDKLGVYGRKDPISNKVAVEGR